MCRLMSYFLAFWMSVICCISTATANESPEAYLEKANTAFDRSDIVNAMRWYRKAAELGNAEAQTRLAYLLDNSEENAEALEWYQKAVDQGYPDAFYGLAVMYAAGEGVPKNDTKAFDLFLQAANSGHIPSIRTLAVTYEEGDLGQPIDYELAVQWLQAGVNANDTWAITRLARAYQRGELGLRIDKQKASALQKQLSKK
jgi:TPR repeat protein